MSTATLALIFWILVVLDLVAMAAVVGMGRGGPNGGMVGAWLLLLPVLVLAGMAVVVSITKSEVIRGVCIVVAAFPLAAAAGEILLRPMLNKAEAGRAERSLRGEDHFTAPAQRELAAALRDCDEARVKQLLPAAGDLNKMYGDTTLFAFAVSRTDYEPQTNREKRRAIVRAMLAAGANPNVPAGEPLRNGVYGGREMIELLLDAGADPNAAGGSEEPFWWQWIDRSVDNDEAFAMLQMFLRRGVDVKKRARGFGPVAHAVHRANWRAALLLIESGAEWRGERSAYVGTVAEDVEAAMRRRPYGETEIPEPLRKIAAMYAASQ